MIGMALFAVLMCVNFAACSSGDDDPTEEKGEGGIVVSGKKLTKIVGKAENSSESETYTFKYDNKGRLIEATGAYEEDGYKYTDTYQFIWGDDAIKVSSESNHTLTLRNGLVQYEEYNDGDKGTYTYNSSNRLIKFSDGEDWINTAIWDGNKLVSVSGSESEARLTYGQSCSKGYFPFIASIMEAGEWSVLYMAHPEIAGMRTNQLPSSITWTYTDNYYDTTESETTNFAYEFNKDGYILKIKGTGEKTFTYTLTWE